MTLIIFGYPWESYGHCRLFYLYSSIDFWADSEAMGRGLSWTGPGNSLKLMFLERFVNIFLWHISWNFLFFEKVKLEKYTTSFYLWNFSLFAWVKLGKYTSSLNMSLGMLAIIENHPCLSCVHGLCHSWVLFGGNCISIEMIVFIVDMLVVHFVVMSSLST